MHRLFPKADGLTEAIIAAAIEVHRDKGPRLMESIYHEMKVIEGIHRLILSGANRPAEERKI
jgi:hypothetical protein